MVTALLLAVCPLAGAADNPEQNGVVVIKGRGSTSSLVNIRRPLQFDSGLFDRLGGPEFGQMNSAYFGFVIRKPGSNQVVAAAVRSRFIEGTVGPATVTMGLSRPVPAGRYLVTLLGGGDVRVVMEVEGGAPSLTWQTSRRSKVSFAAGPLRTRTAVPFAEHRYRLRVTRKTFVLYLAIRSGGPSATRVNQCLVRPTARTCPDASSGVTGLNSGRGGGYGGDYRQPGDGPRGKYTVLTQGNHVGLSGTAGYLVLTLD